MVAHGRASLHVPAFHEFRPTPASVRVFHPQEVTPGLYRRDIQHPRNGNPLCQHLLPLRVIDRHGTQGLAADVYRQKVARRVREDF